MTFPFFNGSSSMKRDRLILKLRIVSEFAEDHLAAVTRAIDQHPLSLVGVRQRQQFANYSKRKTATHKSEKQYQAVNYKDGSRKILKSIEQKYRE